jgi:hypothetical protein
MRAIARTLPLDLRGRPRTLGRADVMAPVGSTGRLVLARARYARRHTLLGNPRELGPAGRRSLGRGLRLRGWAALEAGLDGRLLIGQAAGLTLWDASRGHPRLRLPGARLLAAGERRFAWCERGCREVRIARPEGRRDLDAPGRLVHWVRGAFSPDERRLAVALWTSGGERVAVADLASGAWTLIPGGRLRGYQGMSWSPSGEWLYYASADRRLMAWRVGSDRAERLPIRTGGTVVSLATARAG